MRFIGDIHGRSNWKTQTYLDDINVFVGDYFDSFDISLDNQLENFREIVDLKRQYPDNIVLLIGNHDYHYLTSGPRYSGYSAWLFSQVHEELNKLLDQGVLQWTYKFEKDGKEWMVSHAGVTKSWMDDNELSSIDQINEHLLQNPHRADFVHRFNSDWSGNNMWQGPLWVRPDSLMKDLYPVNQIVGHTPQTHMESRYTGEHEVWFIDTNNREYLIFE